MVTAAETASDFRKRARGQEFGKIHSDLARPHHGRGPPRGKNIGAADIEMACDQFLDVFDLDLFRLRSSHQIANGALGGFHRQRSAIQRGMGEQPVDGSIEIAAIRLNDACDISDDRGRNFESRMHLFRGGYACFKNLDPQRLVEPSDFDAKTASQARSYSFVETFEIARRPVGRDHDLPAGIDQGIERMTELLLNRLALEKLDVVDHKKINRSQPFLESDRRLRFEGGDETIHKSLSGEIDDFVLCRGGSMRGGLEKVSLTQSDRSVEIKRIEKQWVSRRRGSNSPRCGMGELVG